MITFLRQLRNGHNNRTVRPFVHSVALVGMRNIRDYKVHLRPDSESLGTASPFNIITKAFTINSFSEEQIKELYNQHTIESGQIFENDAVELVWQQTQGQPWLVNAIAREVTLEMLKKDYTKPVTASLVNEAIQTIILRRDVHIDSLLDKLQDPRVQRVIEPLMLGEDIDTNSSDFYYVRDLGLIKATKQKIEPANPIYAEVIARTLNSYLQDTLYRSEDYQEYQMPRYLENGKINMDFLMSDFQQFWRENSEIWQERFQYKEAAPHLILMAFLQRVVNGGGQIIREMAAGRGRLDICMLYQNQKYPIEIKLWRGEKTLTKGLEQTAKYMDNLGVKNGILAIFNRNTTISWDDKLYSRKEQTGDKTITVVGL
jgi:hypothetical protein